MRLLIVKLGAIGDIVHSLPALHLIRSQLPEIFIGWAAEQRSAEILRGNELIDQLIEIDTKSVRTKFSARKDLPGIREQYKELKQPKFDVAIDMQGLLKSAAIAKLSGAGQRWGFSRKDLREPASRILLTDTVSIPPKIHVIHKNLLLAKNTLGLDAAANADNDEIRFPIFTGEEHKSEAAKITDGISGEFALLNPAGGWPTKLWPAENYGALADMIAGELNITPVITYGPGEETLAERALSASTSGRVVVARPSLKGFYELARRAAVYVGGDTGPTHIAAAAGAPIVAFFGPTEWWRNGSLNPDDICIERNDIGCRVDCHRRSCSNWICMDIPVDSAFSAIKRRLSAASI